MTITEANTVAVHLRNILPGLDRSIRQSELNSFTDFIAGLF
ncbi:hypothetical protein [Bradyrhizobium sp. AUGA SZCCT0182]|nr:hypothetical protein [Bradyrhizobium sp. AUGA SZCCT0182]